MDIIHSRNTLSPIHAGVIVSSRRITIKRNIIHCTPILWYLGAIARSSCTRDRPSYTLYSHLTPIPTTNATIGEIPNRDRINCRVNLKDKISNLKSIDSLYFINST
ncbi:hypothetical protein QUB60_25195 [Microcoleus sp. A2-C5]|uniref:hypothetical protein n=1 Tax=Microcoleaceae TaxID=1892252 RepID=UPI002238F4F8|nr:hypothetical protein [Lyngbya sp. CCAP 1446/10]MCW6051266.1 hypothetical protein [Lyngbya sp. CCAP 1446/10]